MAENPDNHKYTGREFKNAALQDIYEAAYVPTPVGSLKSEGVIVIAIYPSGKGHFAIDFISKMSLNPLQQLELAKRLRERSDYYMKHAVEILFKSVTGGAKVDDKDFDDMVAEVTAGAFGALKNPDQEPVEDADGDFHAG